MSRSILPLDGPAQHDVVQRLLPWYHNQTLSAGERIRVDEHLSACARCREDLASQHLLVGLLADVPVRSAVDDSFAALSARLHATVPAVSTPVKPLADQRQAHAWPVWLRWMLVAQFSAVVLLALVLPWIVDRAGDAKLTGPYRTLSAAMPARSKDDQLLVAFHDNVSVAAMRASLRAVDGHLVDGPSASGVFVVAVPSGSARRAAERLQQLQAVRLAESLMVTPAP